MDNDLKIVFQWFLKFPWGTFAIIGILWVIIQIVILFD